MCTNLPQEVTDDVLSVLFQQYVGPRTSMSFSTNTDLQVPRVPLRTSGSITDTERKWAESQDGVCHVRLARLGVCRKRSPRWLHAQEGMGDVCFVYLALYSSFVLYLSPARRCHCAAGRPVPSTYTTSVRLPDSARFQHVISLLEVHIVLLLFSSSRLQPVVFVASCG